MCNETPLATKTVTLRLCRSSAGTIFVMFGTSKPEKQSPPVTLLGERTVVICEGDRSIAIAD